ncbi:MAG: phosphodiester glycosidase family protein [Armatimonadetes bacterium]|nr:phosphodiester glycosidase family protein [Armatimonadota bacterium]
MRRLALLVVLIPVLAKPDVMEWEKIVRPGITYRVTIDDEIPRVVHALRIANGAAGLGLRPALSQDRVFGPDAADQGRQTVVGMMRDSSAIAGINADFFPANGDPLGAMVVDGRLLSSAARTRSVVAWGPAGFRFGYLQFAGAITWGDGDPVSIYGVNEECGDNMVVLYTSAATVSLSREPALNVLIESDAEFTPNGEWQGVFVRFFSEINTLEISDGHVALAVRGVPTERILELREGDEVTISLQHEGIDWEGVTHVAAGGPLLVKAGQKFIPFAEEGFKLEFAENRHPRSAIGVTPAGDVWLVAVDGRQSMSDGATLEELAHVMIDLGCTDAINLDGGGSTTLAIAGVVLNRPSGGRQRAIANSILVIDEIAGAQDDGDFVIAGPVEVELGQETPFRVVNDRGDAVPHVEVLWAATGSAWIDQSGILRGFEEGEVTVKAIVNGVLRVLTVRVKEYES